MQNNFQKSTNSKYNRHLSNIHSNTEPELPERTNNTVNINAPMNNISINNSSQPKIKTNLPLIHEFDPEFYANADISHAGPVNTSVEHDEVLRDLLKKYDLAHQPISFEDPIFKKNFNNELDFIREVLPDQPNVTLTEWNRVVGSKRGFLFREQFARRQIPEPISVELSISRHTDKTAFLKWNAADLKVRRGHNMTDLNNLLSKPKPSKELEKKEFQQFKKDFECLSDPEDFPSPSPAFFTFGDNNTSNNKPLATKSSHDPNIGTACLTGTCHNSAFRCELCFKAMCSQCHFKKFLESPPSDLCSQCDFKLPGSFGAKPLVVAIPMHKYYAGSFLPSDLEAFPPNLERLKILDDFSNCFSLAACGDFNAPIDPFECVWCDSKVNSACSLNPHCKKCGSFFHRTCFEYSLSKRSPYECLNCPHNECDGKLVNVVRL